jgi:hypothetical protein
LPYSNWVNGNIGLGSRRKRRIPKTTAKLIGETLKGSELERQALTNKDKRKLNVRKPQKFQHNRLETVVIPKGIPFLLEYQLSASIINAPQNRIIGIRCGRHTLGYRTILSWSYGLYLGNLTEPKSTETGNYLFLHYSLSQKKKVIITNNQLSVDTVEETG